MQKKFTYNFDQSLIYGQYGTLSWTYSETIESEQKSKSRTIPASQNSQDKSKFLNIEHQRRIIIE